MDRKALVVAETDEQMTGLSLSLRQGGLDVLGTSVPAQALRTFYSFQPSILVVDLDIPDFDGWAMCAQIREMADTPIIVLSRKSDRDDLLRGYEIGVDGYIVKPHQIKDVVQRIYAVLKRRANTSNVLQFPAPFQSGNLAIDWSRNEVRVNGNNLSLTPTEFKLLGYLTQNRGRIVTHEQILSSVWGPEYISDKSYVKLYIRYLREKIEEVPSKPRYIVTERGFGYKFVA